jgi:hypothetical protein
MTIPLILLFGIWTVLLVKNNKVSVGNAIVIGLFGIFLAATVVGPSIRESAADLAAWVGAGISQVS